MIKKRAFIRTNLPKCKDLRSEFEKEWEKETIKTQKETSFKAKEPDSKSKVGCSYLRLTLSEMRTNIGQYRDHREDAHHFKVIKRRSGQTVEAESQPDISNLTLKDDFKWKDSNQPFSFDFSIQS